MKLLELQKFVLMVTTVLILSGCFCEKQEQQDFSAETLQLYATKVFLNDTFYQETIPIFENIFNCHVQLTEFPDATNLLDSLLTNDSLNVDVVFGLDNTLHYKVIPESLFVPYESANLKNADKDLQFDDNFSQTSICYSPLAFIYNSNSIQKAPATFGAMQDGIFKDKIIMFDPHTTSLGRAMLIWSVAAFGNNGYGHFWRSVKENIYHVASEEEEGYNMFLAAQAPLVQLYSTASIYHIQQEAENKYKAAIPQEGCFNLIKTAGIHKNSSNRELAEYFIDFLLSEDFQAVIPARMWMYPVNDKIKLNHDYQLLPQVENDYTFNVSNRLITWRMNTWLRRWDKIMNR